MSDRLKSRPLNPSQAQGISAALLSALVLGLAPIFGKQAINAGTPALSVVALRTILAMLSLWLLIAVFWRRFLFIYPVGLFGCLAAGLINGLGSLMYYTGLARLDASVAQMLYTLYPIFLTLFLRWQGHAVSRFTVFRMALGLAAVYLLTIHGQAHADWLGAFLMLAAGLMYAAHLAVNQRVLYDVPAPTVALYTLTAMAATVSVGFLLGGSPALPPSSAAWQAVLLLTIVTVISRLSLFAGLKRLGGVQTSLIGLSELLVTVLSALILLGEKLTPTQWVGAAVLGISILLVVRERGLGTLPAPRPWAPLVALKFGKLGRPAPAAPADPDADQAIEPAAGPINLGPR